MSRESLVFLLGLVVFSTPFLGIPRDWKEWIFIGSGTLLMILGFSLRRSAFLRSLEDPETGVRRADAFVESATPTSQAPDVS
jgi:hypothetical protein